MTRIAIRATATSAIGLGHVARCAALVEEFAARGIVADAMFDGDASLRVWAATRSLTLAPIGPFDDHDLVIVDGPHLLPDIVARRVVALDDRGTTATVDVAINHNVHATPAMYPNARRTLLGRDYLMLRRDITRHGHGACAPRAMRRILVTMGGSDPPNATARILAALPPTIDVDVIVGPGYRGDLPSHPRATVHRAPPDPAAIFVRADAAISSAGGTLGELAYLGVPALGVAIVEDQVAPAAQLAREGAIAGGLWLEDVVLDDVLASFLTDHARRAAIRDRALATADGRGPARIADALLAL